MLRSGTAFVFPEKARLCPERAGHPGSFFTPARRPAARNYRVPYTLNATGYGSLAVLARPSPVATALFFSLPRLPSLNASSCCRRIESGRVNKKHCGKPSFSLHAGEGNFVLSTHDTSCAALPFPPFNVRFRLGLAPAGLSGARGVLLFERSLPRSMNTPNQAAPAPMDFVM